MPIDFPNNMDAIRSEGEYKNGLKNGVWTEWYECSIHDTTNSRLHKLKHFLDGSSSSEIQEHGEHTHKLDRFDDSIKLVTNYKDGTKEGKGTGYDDNGNKLLECNFINNELDGVLIRWDKTGNKTLECNYKNGIKDGLETIWNYNINSNK